MDDLRGQANLALLAAQLQAETLASPIFQAALVRVEPDGTPVLDVPGHGERFSDFLETSSVVAVAPWNCGDRMLVYWTQSASDRPVILGRVSSRVGMEMAGHVKVQAAESVTLQCGEASLTLHAGGKVMIRGEDVLLRAKGTQRIRAGNVAIN